MALPLTGLVSQLEPFWHGLLMQASSRWHSKPASRRIKMSSNCIITLSGSQLRRAVYVEPDAKSRTGASMRTLAEERGHAVVAGGPVVTSGTGAVVDVFAAVVTRPAVDADAVVAAVSVVARPSVLAGVGHQLALIDIFRAVLTWKITGRLKGILQISCLFLI